ncbi:MAG: DUF1707 domain-containing protein [Solirubrobacterales bacterium]|nr:DUF1707 domain-containing protein [Solirubrobacterales bacterium]
MPNSPGVERIGDAQREDLAVTLRAAAADGRLDLTELEERLEHTWAARTLGELAPITADLELWIGQRRKTEQRTSAAHTARSALRYSIATFLTAMAIMVAIWLLTGSGYAWPIWPAMTWGPWVIMQWVITHSYRRHAKHLHTAG